MNDLEDLYNNILLQEKEKQNKNVNTKNTNISNTQVITKNYKNINNQSNRFNKEKIFYAMILSWGG